MNNINYNITYLICKTGRDRPNSARDPMSRVKSSKRFATTSFFLDTKQKMGDGTGSVIKKYPDQKSVRKAVGQPHIPDVEDIVSTKEVFIIIQK